MMRSIFLLTILTILSFSICIFYFWSYSSGRKTFKRVDPWFEKELEKERRSFFYIVGDKYDQSELSENLRTKLAQANLTIKPSEYAGLCIIIFFLLWGLNYFLLSLLFPLDGVLAYVFVWLGSKFFLNSRKNKRSEEFNKQLPEICRMMSNTVKAGLTLQQGIELVSKEMKAPAGPEFNRMIQQLNFGNGFDDVLNRLTNRVDSNELKIFANTIQIQRRVGGNLAEVLSLMADTLEERSRINKEIKTVTAESKFIAIILPVLPFAMAILLNLVIPGFLNPLFTPLGLILLAVFVGMQFVAYLMIRFITRIRV